MRYPLHPQRLRYIPTIRETQSLKLILKVSFMSTLSFRQPRRIPQSLKVTTFRHLRGTKVNLRILVMQDSKNPVKSVVATYSPASTAFAMISSRIHLASLVMQFSMKVKKLFQSLAFQGKISFLENPHPQVSRLCNSQRKILRSKLKCPNWRNQARPLKG